MQIHKEAKTLANTAFQVYTKTYAFFLSENAKAACSMSNSVKDSQY